MIVLGRTQASKDIPLTRAKKYFSERVDELTSIARKTALSSSAGQELTYQEKAKQAKDFLGQDTEPTEDDAGYEFIFAEVGVTADTALTVAEIILSKSTQYNKGLGPAVERLRLIANKGIRAANTEEELRTCVDEFEEDLKLI